MKISFDEAFVKEDDEMFYVEKQLQQAKCLKTSHADKRQKIFSYPAENI